MLHAATFGLAVGDGRVVRAVLRAASFARRGCGDPRGNAPAPIPAVSIRSSVRTSATLAFMALAMTSAWSRSMLPAVNSWATESVSSSA